jgi:hypothetical protein
MTTRTCKACGNALDTSAFYTNNEQYGKKYYKTRCKACCKLARDANKVQPVVKVRRTSAHLTQLINSIVKVSHEHHARPELQGS